MSILKNLLKISLLFFVIFTFTNKLVFAQVLNDSAPTNTFIELKSTPETPKEGDTVKLELSSFNINLDTAKITWYVDGKIKNNGIGVKNIDLVAKGNGQKTSIVVLVTSSDGVRSSTSKEILSNSVDIIIEPASYTPPFYKGKSLFTNQGVARIVAIPNIFVDNKKIDSKNLIYKWQKDGINLSQLSGKGKDSISVTGGVPINNIDVNLDVLDSSGNILTTNSVEITSTDPKIIFYENNALYGTFYNKAISSDYFMGLKEELNITAKPFYFGVDSDSSSNLLYKWFVNGNPVILDSKINELLLKQTTGSLKGTADIKLELRNKDKIFQFTNSDLNVSFGQ